jgi:hypothetical protein
MINVGNGARILDGKECFELWNKHRTLKRVQQELLRKGIHGIKSEDKPPTEKTISDAVWRYILENLEQGRQEMEEAGIIMDDKEWGETIVRRATYILGTSRTRFVNWIKENNLEEFEYIYKRRMGTID